MTPERAAELFKALGNAHRVRIVRQLHDKALRCRAPEACDLSESCCDVGELAANLDVSLPTVSYHLKDLRAAGLVTMRRRGQRLYCALNADALRAALDAALPGTGLGSAPLPSQKE